MTQSIKDILKLYRDSAASERHKGELFERLVRVYFKHDAVQKQFYDDVWIYADWAALRGLSQQDTGIDLVASIKGSDLFCAIQCKFYDYDHRIQKGEIDSFFTASGKKEFGRRIIVDSTSGNWSEPAEQALQGQSIETLRVGLTELEESNLDWSQFVQDQRVAYVLPKTPRPHQTQALEAVRKGFEEADRGKLIMACGTGKTYTGLVIAEALAGRGKRVLFMVPSLSLMSQSVREWTNDASIPLKSFAVCSDVQVGVRRGRDDFADISVHDLAYPATTDDRKLAAQLKDNADPNAMTVVFATYQSIDVISRAQLLEGMDDFDLIICDEAHRTTGAIFQDQEESQFTKIHSDENVRGAKRLYMTATPRIYGENVREKAADASVQLCDMDDESIYGKTLFTRGFSWAVENDLLTDYKVIVLAMDEGEVAAGIQRSFSDGAELSLDDATKMIGCYKALSKQKLRQDLEFDPEPMRRALAFCKDIKSSKLMIQQFGSVVQDFLDTEAEKTGEAKSTLACELDHVDGSYNAKAREARLRWLKEESGGACRILSNARCLSEGVDVPALDAILFLHPRKSQIDVVQSVGRVMRRAEGKKMGYVILPVAIPAGMRPSEALNDNERYKVVWQILNALRSHDERLDATINKMSFDGEDVSDKIEIVAVSNTLPSKMKAAAETVGLGQGSANNDDDRDTLVDDSEPEQQQLPWVDEFASAIMAKIVRKCGQRTYWEDWASSIARIVEAHITRINAELNDPYSTASDAFEQFLAEVRDDLNPDVSRDDAITMIAQHIITQPVFDALFEDYEFSRRNPVSIAMEVVMEVIHPSAYQKETEELERFYESVKRRVAGIKTPAAKQEIIRQLYDSFFRNAFPRTTEKLGIVYTPVEIVDFILHSVNEMLQEHFGQTLGSRGVHIMDPFTGTGTFITRLLQSGLIAPEELEHKYRNEIHANEIVLLAYYIAAINIEAVYQGEAKTNEYVPFEGICLTDTFQMYEGDDELALYMPDNSERRTRQKELDIRVIVGNPPYSVGQSTANDDNANVIYQGLDARIRSTYAARSANTNMRSLYDSYIRAIRWASDRIGDAGVVAYVCNAGWLEGSAADGLRACLSEEFTDLYVFHLRGNARTTGEKRRKEKGNVFGGGSRTPVAINVFVKNPTASDHGRIFFHDIGDYLDQSQKLAIVRDFASVDGISKAQSWSQVIPNEHHDWLSQRTEDFEKFPPLSAKDGNKAGLFETHSAGLKTNRDVWVYDASKKSLENRVRRQIHFFNDQVSRQEVDPSYKVDTDGKKFKWCQATLKAFERHRRMDFHDDVIQAAMYRPFQKQWVYKHKSLNWSSYLMPRYFPTVHESNLCICMSGPGGRGEFTALMSDVVPSIHFADRDGIQSVPLNLYDQQDDEPGGLFEGQSSGLQRRDGITDAGLAHFEAAYPGAEITKEDLFYYVYGLLHSPDYRDRYADNLTKELPRIPAVKTYADFRAFSDAGRRLGDLHVNYETVEPYPVTYKQGTPELWKIDDTKAFYRVTKMKFGGNARDKDKTTVIYNANITMTDVPLEAYEYVVNGKPALEWVMERQVVKTDKASGIVNDANDYANETMNNPAYPLELFQRVITVSLETMKIVRGLPELDLPD